MKTAKETADMKRKTFEIKASKDDVVIATSKRHSWNASIKEAVSFIQSYVNASESVDSLELTNKNYVQKGTDFVSGTQSWVSKNGETINISIKYIDGPKWDFV